MILSESRLSTLGSSPRASLSESCSSLGAVLLEQADDLLLLRLRVGRAAAAATGGQAGEPQRRRAAIVPALGIGAAGEQRRDRGGAARAYGAMQRRHAIHVDRVRIGARLDQ